MIDGMSYHRKGNSMTRVLAVIRRLFLGGTISLLLSLFLFGISWKTMYELAISHNSFAGYFSIFFIVAPVVYLIFVLISVAYIRKHGQFAAVHQSQSKATSFFRCIGSDLASPFKNIKNFVVSLFSKEVTGKSVIIGRFFEMVLLILACMAGIGSLLQ